MQYFKAQSEYVVVLKKGDDLLASLRTFAEETDVTAAWLQGLGAALELEIGYYNLDTKAYAWKQLEGPHEITGMQGNIVRDDANQPLFHIHGTFSDSECRAFGGHINRLIVGGTCEMFVKPLAQLELARHKDQATGLNLLCDAAN